MTFYKGNDVIAMLNTQVLNRLFKSVTHLKGFLH